MRYLLSYLLSLCLSTAIFAQEVVSKSSDPYYAIQYTIRDGIASQQVKGVMKDRKGYLWIEMWGGISRFDGKNFQTFGEKDSLIGAGNITGMVEDKDGNIWFGGGANSKLIKYDGKRFYDIPIPNKEKFFIQLHYFFKTNKIWLNNNDTKWAYYEKNTLYHKKDILSDTSLAKYSWSTRSFKETALIRINKSKENEKNYFQIWNEKNKTLTPFQYGKVMFHEVRNLNDEYLLLEYRPKQDTVIDYYLTSDVSLKDIKKVAHYDKKSRKMAILAPFEFNSVLTVTANENFYILKNTVGTAPMISADLDLLNIDNSNRIDKGEGLWLSSEHGLTRLLPRYITNYTTTQIPASTACIQDNKGNYFFSNYQHPISVFDANKKLLRIDNTGKKDEGLDNFYYGSTKDKKGNLYFCGDFGVMRYNGKKYEILTNYDKENLEGGTLSMLYLYYDETRNWLLVGARKGLLIFDLNKGDKEKAKYYGQNEGIEVGGYVLGISYDKKRGVYWLSGGKGVAQWNPETKKVKKIVGTENKEVAANSILADRHGSIWSGSATFFRYYDEKTDKMLEVDTLFRSVFGCIAEYDSSHILIGCKDGVYLMNTDIFRKTGKLQLQLFNRQNGYNGLQPDQNGFFKDNKGETWVMSLGAVASINQQLHETEQNTPRLHIQLINDTPVVRADTFHLPYRQHTIKAQLGITCLSPYGKVEYSYRLIGHEDEWSAWSEVPIAVFGGLRKKDYTLEVRARIVGMPEIATQKLVVVVNIPFWRDPFILRIAAIILGFVLLFWAYTGFRNWQNERKVKQMVRDLDSLQVQMLQSQMNPHFIFNILTSLQNVIYNADKEIANRLLIQLSVLIRRFLESSVSSNNNDIMLSEEIELLKMYIEFERFVKTNKFDYSLTIAPNIDTQSESLPPLMIQPYIENAIKHGILLKEGKGFLKVHFSKPDEDTLICIVEDDGVGKAAAAEMQKKYLKPYKSLGTDLIEKRCIKLNQLGYSIAIKDEEIPIGTKVVLTFGAV